MTFHRRADWTSVPAADAHRLRASRVKGVAIHWNGPAVPASALTDPRAYLEGVRRFHRNTRGWSDIAYNFAVDAQGHVWELRGRAHQSAANGSVSLNEEYVAILAILGEGQKPTPAMVRGIRKARRRVLLRWPLARKLVGHGDIRPGGTACPGPDLQRLVDAKKPLRPWKPKPPAPVCTQSCPVHCPKESA